MPAYNSPNTRVVDLVGPEEALAAHDAAHARADETLHALSVRLLTVCGLEHMVLDSLDATLPPDPLDGLPPIIRLQEGAVCRMNDRDLVVPEDAAGNSTGTEAALIRQIGGFDSRPSYQVHVGALAGRHQQVYDLCLVRRRDAVESVADGITVGEFMPLGGLRESGAFRFPVIAQSLPDRLVQIHKRGDEVMAFDEDGKMVDAEWEAIAAIDTPQAVYLGCIVDGQPILHDVLVNGYEQTHLLPSRDRLQRMPCQSPELPARTLTLSTPEALLNLDRGRWLIRWEEETVDFEAPYWFVYDGQTVRPGQYVPPAKALASLQPATPIATRLLGGVRCQAHVCEDRVCLFIEECAADRSDLLRQVTETLRGADVSSAIFDGELVGEVSTNRLSSLLFRRRDISDLKVRLVLFDCLYLDGRDLHDLPLTARLDTLREIDLGSELAVAEQVDGLDGPGLLIRDAGTAYPLDGQALDWTERPPEPAAPESPPPLTRLEESAPSPDETLLSREWVGDAERPVAQDDFPLRFAYYHRIDGLLPDAEATQALNMILAGDPPGPARQLNGTLEEVRTQYREAHWRKAPKVLRQALGPITLPVDVSKLVVPVSMSGALFVEAPPYRDRALALSQAVVNDGLQFLTNPRDPQEIGVDLFLSPGTDAQWSAEQRPTAPLEWLEQRSPGLLYWDMEERVAYHLLATGEAVLGVQKPHFHEVFLLFDDPAQTSGRYVWSLADVKGERVWLAKFPDEQEPYIYKHDQQEQIDKAQESGGWIAWNPEGVRVLAATDLSRILPLNWEDRLEGYEDAPFVDFVK